MTREDRTAVEEHGRKVEPRRGHQHPGQALVAAGKRDERVQALGVHDALDRVGDDLPRHEGTPHALVTHRDAVADGDRDELDREAAGITDAELRPLCKTVERHVARCDLVPARRDPDLALAPVGVGHPDRAQHRPGAGLLHAVGHVPAARLHIVRLWAHVFRSLPLGPRSLRSLWAAQRIGGPTLTDVALVLVATGDGVVPILDGVPAAVELGGRRVDALARRRDEWWAVADGHTVVHRDGAGTWTELATAEQRLTCVLPAPGGGWCGTSDGRLLRLLDGRFAPSRRVRRSRWSRHVARRRQPAPLRAIAHGDRRRSRHCSPTVHVGGIPRSGNGGASWKATIDPDADVHQVRAHPSDPGLVLAAAAVGLAVSRDGGATWDVTTEGLHATYLRAVAYTRDAALVSACDGPFGKLGALYRWDTFAGGDLVRVADGLPEWLAGNVDTAKLDADSTVAAFADSDAVYASNDGGGAWSELARDLGEVHAVGILET